MEPMTSTGRKQHLVLVGGGHTHVHVLKQFGVAPMPGLTLTLLSPDRHTPYSGMIPGFIAGHYAFEDAHIDLERLARFAAARFVRDEAIGLDLAGRQILCRGHAPLRFDVLSIDIGATPELSDVPGAEAHAIPIKPIANFLERWRKLSERVLARPGRTRIAVVGAGAGGVEMLLAIRHRLRQELADAGRAGETPRFDLFSDSPTILPTHARRVRAIFGSVLAERGVTIHTGQPVVRASPRGITTADGVDHDADEILWATAAGAAPWLGRSGLKLDEKGFIAIDETLRSLSDPAIFAAGDVATMQTHPRPKAGVFAVRQGPPLAENLRRTLSGRAPQPFIPQQRYLSLISTGDRCAVASRGDVTLGGPGFAGSILWRLKDWIDCRFVATYNAL
jgi:selenide,water dikinase